MQILMLNTNQFILVLVLSIFFMSVAKAGPIDSLEYEISLAKDDFQKAKLYNELASVIDRSDVALTVENAQKALDLAIQNNYPKQANIARYTLSYMEVLKGNLDSAFELINTSLSSKEEDIDLFLKGKLLHILGLAYQLKGDYSNAMINYHNALQVNEELGAGSQMIRQLNNMSLVRRELKDYDLAFSYLEQSSNQARELKDTTLMWYSEVNKAYVLLDQKRYEEALKYAKPILESKKMNQDTFGMSASRNILAQIYLGLEDYSKAMKYADHALEYAKLRDYKDGVVHAKFTRSNIFFEYQQFDKAKDEALEALSISDDDSSTRYVEGLLDVVTKSYEKLGNYKQALLYKDKLIQVKESIFNVEKEALAYKMDIDFQTKRKELENIELRSTVALNDKVITKQAYQNYFVSLLAGFALILGFIMFQLYKRRKVEAVKLDAAVKERTQELELTNQELRDANEEIKRFAYVVSHDLKEPLRNIISFNDLLDQKLYSTPELRDYTKFIKLAAEQQRLLIDTILEFSKLRNIQLDKMMTVDPNAIIENILDDLPKEDSEKLRVNISKIPKVTGLESLIHVVFDKLISNALAYNKSDAPKVEIDARVIDDFVEFKISDNGIGIAKEYQEDIFNMFSRLNKRSEYLGSGLGLATAKKIVNSHEGKIWVESTEGKGSSFFFTLKKAA